MDGITVVERDDYSIFIIDKFSDEIKNAIRVNLSSICNGAADAATGQMMYSYSNTLKEFIKRYDTKSDNQKKGMIGELLLHIILTELLNDRFVINSPFFNIEERSVKKGFDVVLNKTGTQELWIAEVKSGETSIGKTVSNKAVELINTAKNDLVNRLNGESVSLWRNAINGARIAMSENRDDKSAIISLLQECGNLASDNSVKSDDFNVILVGTVFSSTCDQIVENDIASKQKRITYEKCFQKAYLIAIQKETYQKVYNYIESESKNEPDIT